MKRDNRGQHSVENQGKIHTNLREYHKRNIYFGRVKYNETLCFDAIVLLFNMSLP